jgi:curved DNA-binding protein
MIRVAPHPDYQRTGNTLHRTIPVGLYTAVLGGNANIETMKGKVKINIARGTANGKELRLRGLGMPDYARKSPPGDPLVTVNGVLPENLTDQETRLFKELQSLRNDEYR